MKPLSTVTILTTLIAIAGRTPLTWADQKPSSGPHTKQAPAKGSPTRGSSGGNGNGGGSSNPPAAAPPSPPAPAPPAPAPAAPATPPSAPPSTPPAAAPIMLPPRVIVSQPVPVLGGGSSTHGGPSTGSSSSSNPNSASQGSHGSSGAVSTPPVVITPPATPPVTVPPAGPIVQPAAPIDPEPDAGVWVREFPVPANMPNVSVQAVGNGWRVTNPQLGELMSPTSWPTTWPTPQTLPFQITRTWTAAPNGLDITYTLVNNTSQAHPMPQLLIPGYNMANTVDWLYFTPDTHFIPLSWTSGASTVAPDQQYPRIMYAPMHVAKDSRFALGVALKYPVLEYKHNIRMIFRKNGDQTTWMTCVALDGEIPPNTTRTYGVTVRFTHPNDWIHTLAPYKTYLHQMYGEEPQYQQDLRPVFARVVAFPSFIASDNPRGFRSNFRSDLNGWDDQVDFIINHAQAKGYERVMIWAAAGLYDIAQGNNYPPQFMTNWTQPMQSSGSEWNRINQAGIDLGFWWGRSAQVADGWNDLSLEAFNYGSSTHHSLMLPEIQLAHQRGAKIVGMDSFRMMNAWDAVLWLQQLHSIDPNIKFVGEPSSSDVMHMHQPLFSVSWWLNRAPLLHDYLVPGREFWCQLEDDDANLARALQAIGWGLTICVNPESFDANTVQYAVENAQNGWVLAPGAEVVPGPMTYVGD